MSQQTRRSLLLWLLTGVLDLLALVGPVLFYVIYALVNEKVSQSGKIVVIGTTAAALIILLFNILFQKHLRSPIWLIFLGLYYAMDKLMVLVIIIGICSILDEFILSPLSRYYRSKTIANRAIDQRLS